MKKIKRFDSKKVSVIVHFLLLQTLFFIFNCSSSNQIKSNLSAAPQLDEDNLLRLNLQVKRADSLYKEGQYHLAVEQYSQVYSTSSSILENPMHAFKIAYSFFRIDSVEQAIFWFKKILKLESEFLLKDYVQFFLGQSYLQKKDTTIAVRLWTLQLEHEKNEYIKSLINWKLCQVERDSILKLQYLKKIKTRYLNSEIDSFVVLKIALFKQFESRDEYFHLLKRAASQNFHRSVENQIFNELKTISGELSNEDKIDILDIFLDKRDDEFFEQWLNLLNGATDFSPQQFARLNMIKALKLYQDRKYNTAFKVFNRIPDKYLTASMLAEKYLHLARCNARLGFTNEAIKRYYTFHKKFPRHKLAADALWWIALTFEQRKDFKRSQKYLNLIARKYKKEGIEARFRLAFMDILHNKRKSAIQKLKSMVPKLDYNNQLRAKYWLRYLYLLSGNEKEARELTDELIADPLQNFYTITVFLKAYSDSLDYYTSLLSGSHHQSPMFEKYLAEQLDRVMMVKELLGSHFAQFEMKSIRKKNKLSPIEMIQLAELHQQLGNYAEAYRLFRDAYYAKYIGLPWKEKLHIVKKLYPLYYDQMVFKETQKYNLDPLLVYGIMKRESMFQKEVRSYANAFGLLQILPSTAKLLSRESDFQGYQEPIDLFKPDVNITLGIYYLSKLKNMFDGNYPAMIASYNAGESRVKRWLERYKTENDELFMELIPIQQTRDYVKYVLTYYYIYQWFYNSGAHIHFKTTNNFSKRK